MTYSFNQITQGERLRLQMRPQVLPFHIRHNKEERALLFSAVVHRNDRRMVHLCDDPPEEGLFLTAELDVALPAMPAEEARSLMSEAKRTCPYAKMARTGLHAMFSLR